MREVGERVGGWTPASVEMRMGVAADLAPCP